MQGQFTKEEGKATLEAVQEMFLGIAMKRRVEYLGHLNDVFLFIEAAIEAAPHEVSN